MGLQWVVKNAPHKSTMVRKTPLKKSDDSNIVGTLKNGDIVSGEFLYVQRASREVGFVKTRHLEAQCGHTWRVCNDEGFTTTLLRRSPIEASDASNIAGKANDGELVTGEFLFIVSTKVPKGGYVKRATLKPFRAPMPAPVPISSQPAASSSTAAPSQQQWVVMDSNHDGAWLRKEACSDRTSQNVVSLIRNGDKLAGDFVLVRRTADGLEGFMRFRHLEQLKGKSWRIRGAAGSGPVLLRKRPAEDRTAENTAGSVTAGDVVEGEYVYVTRLDGKKSGYVKRAHLTALAVPCEGTNSSQTSL
mmetsp:Transcript_75965/g.180677  ORF Transcript_75965/g.180677 Transcript_75965/m.180677 type:complete len:303 (+) Transcript_75965:93-1001(+)